MNHTDRELLELAAKAAGYDTSHQWNSERLMLEPPVAALCIPEVSTGWDPLTNDKHALRLAVKLGLLIDITAYNDRPFKKTTVTDGKIQVHETHNGDPYAATRRAIVRAAAEIGRAAGGAA